MKKNIITSIVILLSFSVQCQSWWNSERVKGNGKVITKTRTISKFDKITVSGSFNVLLTEGREGKIIIEGEDNIIPYIITEVKGSDLKIRFENNININDTKKLNITIPFDEIEELSLNGSGNIKVEKLIKAHDFYFNQSGSGNIMAEIDANFIDASIAGSGNLRLKGNTEKLKYAITGSGNFKTYDLKTNELKANISGSGNIQINVTDKINANIVGSGNLSYKGNPRYIDTNTVGSGNVRNRN